MRLDLVLGTSAMSKYMQCAPTAGKSLIRPRYKRGTIVACAREFKSSCTVKVSAKQINQLLRPDHITNRYFTVAFQPTDRPDSKQKSSWSISRLSSRKLTANTTSYWNNCSPTGTTGTTEEIHGENRKGTRRSSASCGIWTCS